MSKIKQFSIVVPICFLLAGAAVLLYLLDPAFVPDLWQITSMIIVVLWAFFIVPAFLLDAKLAVDYFGGKSPERAFRDGVRIGVYLKGGGLIVLCFLFSPIGGTIWFVQTINQIFLSLKQKKETKPSESDPFHL